MSQLRILREIGLNTVNQLVTVSVGPDSSAQRCKNCLKACPRVPSTLVTFAINITTLRLHNNFLVLGIAAGIINGVFWFLYNMTGNIGSSIGITAGVFISISVALRMIGKRK